MACASTAVENTLPSATKTLPPWDGEGAARGASNDAARDRRGRPSSWKRNASTAETNPRAAQQTKPMERNANVATT